MADTTTAAYEHGFECGQNEYMHHATFYAETSKFYSTQEYNEAVAGFKAGRKATPAKAKAEISRRLGKASAA